MQYGIYRHIRNAAWQTIIDYHITSLPVDVMSIANSIDIRVINDSHSQILEPNQLGVTVFCKNEWNIVYRNDLTVPEKRYTVAHELGHIFLGTFSCGLEFSSVSVEKKRKSETQADNFARSLLCPACVLWKTNTIEAEQIVSLCDVPLSVAKTRSKRLKTLIQRGKFLYSSLEQSVLQNFSEYIDRYNTVPEIQHQLDCMQRKKEEEIL